MNLNPTPSHKPSGKGSPETSYDFLPTSLLVQTGRRWGVQSLRTGVEHPILLAAARSHAIYQAKVGVQGHQDFDDRVDVLFKTLPAYTTFREIVAESWENRDEATAAEEMFESWQSSEEHWAAANGRCDLYGYAMAFSPTTRKWYACAIMCDKR